MSRIFHIVYVVFLSVACKPVPQNFIYADKMGCKCIGILFLGRNIHSHVTTTENNPHPSCWVEVGPDKRVNKSVISIYLFTHWSHEDCGVV